MTDRDELLKDCEEILAAASDRSEAAQAADRHIRVARALRNLLQSQEQGGGGETPLSDSVMELAENLKPGTVVVRVKHMRNLERQRNALRTPELELELNEVTAERDKLRRENEELKGVLHAAKRGYEALVRAGPRDEHK